MKPYPAYKDSGIEWIGEIPEHWEINKIKYSTYVKGRIGWQGLTSDEYIDEGPLLVTGTDFDGGVINWENCHHITEGRYIQDTNIQLKENDLLITKDGTIGKIALVKGLTGKATLNSGVFLTRPETNEYITEFMYWILNSKVFNEYIEYTKTGSTIQHLYQDTFVNFAFALPGIDEQRTIYIYINQKTSQLDTIIEKKQKQIELLKEERTAIINQAVTKGLNPDVPMKDSGIEWLGEVPENWEIIKLKKLLKKIGSGVTPKGGAEVYQEEGIPIIRSQNVHIEGLKLDDVAYISEEIHRLMSRSAVEPNDVLINITGASIGRCTIVPDSFGEANVNQHVCILRPQSDVNSDYLHLFLSSDFGQLQVWASQNGAAREGLNYEQLGNFLIPLPSVAEQKDIVQEVRSNTDIILHSISLIDKQITFLQEYRTALISNAVTGKIDVRDAPTASIE